VSRNFTSPRMQKRFCFCFGPSSTTADSGEQIVNAESHPGSESLPAGCVSVQVNLMFHGALSQPFLLLIAPPIERDFKLADTGLQIGTHLMSYFASCFSPSHCLKISAGSPAKAPTKSGALRMRIRIHTSARCARPTAGERSTPPTPVAGA